VTSKAEGFLSFDKIRLTDEDMTVSLKAADLPKDPREWTLAQIHKAAEVLGAAQAVRVENIAGQLEHEILERGSWYVAQRLGGMYWYIENKVTGRRVKIGRVGGRRVNYFDRAREEAMRRNLALSQEGGV
jgi:hypothetical protein